MLAFIYALPPTLQTAHNTPDPYKYFQSPSESWEGKRRDSDSVLVFVSAGGLQRRLGQMWGCQWKASL